jgi:hypothetical protein
MGQSRSGPAGGMSGYVGYPPIATDFSGAANFTTCHEETFARKSAGVDLRSIRWKVGLIFLSDYR